ncbi:MAG TPA: DNA-processing protein DprA [Parasegetibacter sp.]
MNQLLYEMAITEVPLIGPVQTKLLAQHFGDAESVFRAKRSELEKLEGIGKARANAIKSFKNFRQFENDIHFIETYKIKPLFITNANYPQRLLHCYDPPSLLYYKGEADLNSSRIIGVIGTRKSSAYGRKLTESLIEELAAHNVIVVSGLALGIDVIAHRACLKYNVPTVGILAHGLDSIYPPEHKDIARKMQASGGGLLTEFRKGVKADKHHFPSRNRIVAGICDGLVVVETGIKGGSMITADLAIGYNRDVFAFPGRTTDAQSQGCNLLIKSNKALLVQSPADILGFLGWETKAVQPGSETPQRALFPDLTDEEMKVINLLEKNETSSVDQIYLQSGLSQSSAARVLLSLELKGLVRCLPGKIYEKV